MTTMQILADPGMLPFIVAFGVVLGLVVLELIMMLLGFSSLGENGDGIDVEPDLDVGLDLDGIDLDGIDLEGVDLDGLSTEGFDLDALGAGVDTPSDTLSQATAGGSLGWLGLGAIPMILWLASQLSAFAMVGYGIQLTANAVLGGPMGAWLAAALALVPSLAFGGWISRGIGRLIPKSESSAISTRSYGRRRGVITVGTARADKPAQARFTDGHGNMHYAMVTPMDPNDAFPQGTEVLILRSRDGALKAIALS